MHNTTTATSSSVWSPRCIVVSVIVFCALGAVAFSARYGREVSPLVAAPNAAAITIVPVVKPTTAKNLDKAAKSKKDAAVVATTKQVANNQRSPTCDLDPKKVHAPLCRPCLVNYDISSSSTTTLFPCNIAQQQTPHNDLTLLNAALEAGLPPAPCTLDPAFKAIFTDVNSDHSDASMLTRFSRISLLDYLRLYRWEHFETILNERRHSAVCLLSLFHAKGACMAHVESLDACAIRIGLQNIEKLVPDKCLLGPFWNIYRDSLKRRHPEAVFKAKNPEAWKTMFRGIIPHSTVRKTSNEGRAWIPPSQRKMAKLGAPLICNRNGHTVTLHPIGFAIPETAIVATVPRTKAFDFMPLPPGRHMGDRLYRTGISQESIFREMYSSSFFAFSNYRGGWDCMRHYEILASGCVMHFPELDYMPEHTMTHLPRELLKEALELPGIEHVGKVPPRHVLTKRDHEFYLPIHSAHIHFKKPGTIVEKKFDRVKYLSVAERLLNFTQNHLTTGAMVNAMLNRMGRVSGEDKHLRDEAASSTASTSSSSKSRSSNLDNHGFLSRIRKVLLVSRYAYDYLHAVIQNGFAELGIQTTIVGENSLVWMHRLKHPPGPLEEMAEIKRGEAMQRLPGLYGAGFDFLARGFARENGTDHEYVVNKNDPQLPKRLEAGEFDAVIYTYIFNGMHRDAPYLEAVKRSMPKGRIAFLDHDDANFHATHEYKHLVKIGTVFARELDSRRSCNF